MSGNLGSLRYTVVVSFSEQVSKVGAVTFIIQLLTSESLDMM